MLYTLLYLLKSLLPMMDQQLLLPLFIIFFKRLGPVSLLYRTGVVLFTALFITACNQVKPAPDSLRTVAGVIIKEDGQYWFQPCFERNWWRMQDKTTAQDLTQYYSRFSGAANQPVYMELDLLPGAVSDPVLRAYHLRVAGGTAATCSFRLAGLEYRAASFSPYWVADIDDATVTVKSANPVARYSFSTEKKPLNSNGYEFLQAGAATDPFSIRITAGRCVDKDNGTLLNYLAQMQLFGQAYTGCARAGRMNNATPVIGYYWYGDSTARSSELMLFRLSANHRVDLVSRQPGQETITVRGTWQYLESGKLILTMKDRQNKGFLLMFTRLDNRSLVLEAGLSGYGSKGSEYRFWQPLDLPGGQLSRKLIPQAEVLRQASQQLPKSVAEIGFKVVPAQTGLALPEIIVSEEGITD